MAPSQQVHKWLTLIAHCFASFSNTIVFGIYFTNLDIFSSYYNVTNSAISNTFFIGLIFEIIFCLPAIKVIQWRLDYSLICGAFLSMSGYWVQYAAQNNFIVVVCCMSLESFGQSLLLPMTPYLAQRWFPLHQRSVAIAISFYSSFLGFTFGSIFTTLYITDAETISNQMLIISIISTFCFMVALVFAKNKPNVLLQKYQTTTMKQLKDLWRYRYNTYLIIMSSVFLGLSWTFLSLMSSLCPYFTAVELSILMALWIGSGCAFGIIMSLINNRGVSKDGTFTFYDRAAKIILLIGLVGYTLMGVCYMYNLFSLVGYIFLVIFIGIGSNGFYGFMYMSIIETFYPLSSLVIGNLLNVGASLYSALAFAFNIFTPYNPFFILSSLGLLPFVYIAVTYTTNFKRYRYYLDEKKFEYVLLKIQDTKSYFNDRKYQ